MPCKRVCVPGAAASTHQHLLNWRLLGLSHCLADHPSACWACWSVEHRPECLGWLRAHAASQLCTCASL